MDTAGAATAAAATALATAALHLQAGKMFQLAGFVMMIYDHALTLANEVQYVWKRPLSGATILFALNRYITPLKFIVEVVAFQSPAWTKNVWACDHFVRFEGGGSIAITAVAESIMMLRVYAIWERDGRILAFLGCLWVIQVAFCTMALVYTERVPLPSVLVGCMLTGSLSHAGLFIPFWVMPLITDSAVFLLTLWRTQKFSRGHNKMALFQVLQRDGVLYFLCIFSANLLNVILFLTAMDDLKALGAGFSQMITSLMISRLVINLRSLRTGFYISDHGPIPPQNTYDKYMTTDTSLRRARIESGILWNLAEPSGGVQFAHWDDNTLNMQDL
ncbi:hypothetical protein JB92DRAFT_3094244 [Gautieria morchelliformis]|nr:hypothetical protein JB92DRAFT_3094244 [Gautieria morchelliformis]